MESKTTKTSYSPKADIDSPYPLSESSPQPVVLTSWRRLHKRTQTIVRILFEKRDLWVGLYWTIDSVGALHLYFCPVPMLVVHIKVRRT